MLSYVVFQINEGLLALFWGVLFLLAARFWLGVGDIDFLIILFMVIPGVDLLGFGTWLLFKPRKRQ